MPSTRKAINVRMTPETEAESEQVREIIRASTGLQVSHSDMYRMGLAELRRRYSEPKAAKNKSEK